jgi:predicted nucleic acid-binding protein
MIHLDTNFLIQALVPNCAAETKLQTWLGAGEDLGISAIAWSEFLCGPLTANDAALAEGLFDAPEPFLASDARKGQPNYSTRLAIVRAVLLTARSRLWRCAAKLVWLPLTHRTLQRFKPMD